MGRPCPFFDSEEFGAAPVPRFEVRDRAKPGDVCVPGAHAFDDRRITLPDRDFELEAGHARQGIEQRLEVGLCTVFGPAVRRNEEYAQGRGLNSLRVRIPGLSDGETGKKEAKPNTI